MRLALLLTVSLGVLAACGADAPPLPREKKSDRESPPTGIVLSGDARIGVTGRF